MFACLYVPPLAGERAAGAEPWESAHAARGDLASLAREFSPRVEVHRPALVTLDARGLERLFGDADSLGNELRRAAVDRRLPVRVALASTRTAAWLMAHARAGLTVVPRGSERAWVAPLPLGVLEQLAANGLGPARPGVSTRGPGAKAAGAKCDDDMARHAASLLVLLRRWGIKTVGEFGNLPSLALSERMGQEGLAWQQLARGEEMLPLVPDTPDERFEESLDLEWPIEGLQPLSFVFGRLFDALSARLERRDRAAGVLHVHLQLVNRQVVRRSLQLPAPMREPRALRTLALLNLEAHPVDAGIDRVTVIADPVPGRVIQCSLLTRAVPFPEQISTLLGRLAAVMGDRRCGMAAVVDSYRPGAFEMKQFLVSYQRAQARKGECRSVKPHPCIRRFRVPIPASVIVEDGRPARVGTGREGLRGGAVEACAGPWRTSGEWWLVSDARVQSADGQRQVPQIGWNRDEWDVNLSDGGVYRIYRDRDRNKWFVDGVID